MTAALPHVSSYGEGHPVLLLHGGAGPASVEPWGARLAAQRSARVIVPTHPGFDGTERPDSLDSIRALAAHYVDLLDDLDLDDVTVVGNSIGGWTAAEMAIVGSRRVSSYVIVDAVGAEVDGHPVAPFFDLSPAELAQRSYADPATYGLDPTTLSPETLAIMAGNRVTLATYGGTAMTDPTLLSRLAAVDAPVLVVWGEADRIDDPAHGAAIAEAIPGADLVVIPDAGHMPQIEQPDVLVDLVWSFADRHARAPLRSA